MRGGSQVAAGTTRARERERERESSVSFVVGMRKSKHMNEKGHSKFGCVLWLPLVQSVVTEHMDFCSKTSAGNVQLRKTIPKISFAEPEEWCWNL